MLIDMAMAPIQEVVAFGNTVHEETKKVFNSCEA